MAQFSLDRSDEARTVPGRRVFRRSSARDVLMVLSLVVGLLCNAMATPAAAQTAEEAAAFRDVISAQVDVSEIAFVFRHIQLLQCKFPRTQKVA